MGILLKEAEKKKGRWLSGWPCSLSHGTFCRKWGWGWGREDGKREGEGSKPRQNLRSSRLRGKFKYFSQHRQESPQKALGGVGRGDRDLNMVLVFNPTPQMFFPYPGPSW